ncbi:MAG: Ig-like domain repeat protein [Treponema sp.]|nr:Ig-like domain repeat protein [Treponema sp.]
MRRFFEYIFAAIVSFCLLFSCTIGLGNTIDTETPIATITIPDPADVAVIRGDFPVKGTWTDDGKIESVYVTVKTEDASVVYEGDAAVVDKDTETAIGSWSLVVSPSEYGIKDGSYSVSVLIRDTAGHTSSTSSQIVIDNTSPFIALSRPSSAASDSAADSFGRSFILEGEAADDNSVELIEVNFYSDSEMKNKLHTRTLENVPNTIKLNVAEFVEGDTENDYYKIYGSSSVTNAVEKTFYCSIVAYDGARHYPTDGSEQSEEDKKGNATNIYYIKDSVSSLISSYKAPGLYHIKAGTYEGDDTSTVLPALNSKAVSLGKFTLNPANNPKFTVSPKYEFKNAEKIKNKDPIQVEISPGLDGNALKLPLKVYAQACTSAGVVTGSKIYPDQTAPVANVSSYKITATFNRAKFKTNTYYKLGVEGTDSAGNSVIASSSDGYGFKFVKSEIEPLVTLTQPQDGAIFKKGQNVIVSGTVKFAEEDDFFINLGDEELFSVGDDDGIEASEVSEETPGKLSYKLESEDNLLYSFKYCISAGRFNQSNSGTYSISFPDTKALVSFIYDVVAPTISIRTSGTSEKDSIGLGPVAYLYKNDESGDRADENEYVNGNFVFEVKVTDDAAGSEVDFSNVSVKVNGGVSGLTTSQSFTTSDAVVYSFNTQALENESEMTITVTASDKAGNEKSESKTYIVNQETDKPVILPIDPSDNIHKLTFIGVGSSKEGVEGQKEYNIITLDDPVIKFKFLDDDGLVGKELNVSYSCTKEGGSSVTGTAQHTPDENGVIDEYTIPDVTTGFYYIEVTARDAANETSNNSTTANFWIRVAPGAPEASISELDNVYINAEKSVKANVVINSTEAPFRITREVLKGNTVIESFKSYSELSDITDSSLITGPVDGKYTYNAEFTPDESFENGEYSIRYKVYDNNNGNTGDDSITDYKTFYFDNDAETLKDVLVPALTDDMSGSFTFKLDYTKNGDSPVNHFYWAFTNEGETPASYTETSSESYKAKLSELFSGEGKKTAWVYTVDQAGNKSQVKTKTFVYDISKPQVSITENSFNTKDQFKLNISASDTWGLKKLELYQSIDGGTETLVASKTDFTESSPATSAAWETDNLPSNLVADTYKTYNYKVLVTDLAGRTSESDSIIVTIDNKKPDLSFTSAEDSILSGTLGEIAGKASDEGLGLAKLHYTIKKVDNTVAEREKNFAGETAETEWTISETLGSGNTLAEGYYTLSVYAEDGAGNKSDTKTLMFYVDLAKPLVKSAKINDSITLTENSVVYLKTDSAFSVNGVITETNELGSVVVKVGDTEVPSEKLSLGNKDANGDYTFTASDIAKPTENSEVTITVTATDVANQSTSAIYKIYNDKTAPQIEFNSPVVEAKSTLDGEKSLSGNSYTFRTNMNDGEGSGIASYKYYFTKDAISADSDLAVAATAENSSWTEGSGTNFRLTRTLSGTDADGEGLWYAYFYAVDNVGNESTDWFSYWVDQKAPEFSDVNEISAVTNEGFTLSGKVTDSNGISSLVITEGEGDNLQTYATITSFTNDAWSQKFKVGNETTENAVLLSEGEHILTITATDGAGRTSSIEKTVFVDTNAPTGSCLITSDAVSETYSEWYNTQTISVCVNGISDGSASSGILQVQATADDADDENAAWTNLSPDKNSTTSYSGSVYCENQGRNVITYRITDKAGNSNDLTSTLYVDTLAPDNASVFSVVMGTKTEEENLSEAILVNGKNDATVVLEAADANASVTDGSIGIAKIELIKIGSTTLSSSIGGVEGSGDNAGKWTFSVPGNKLETGSMVFKLTDKAGNAWEYTSDVSFDKDNTYPLVTIDSITDADTSSPDEIDVNNTINITGKASDNNSLVSLQLQYRTSTTTTFSGDWNNYGGALTTDLASWSVEVNTKSLTPPSTTPVTTDKYYVQFQAVGTDKAQNTGNTGNNTAQYSSAEDAVRTVYINQSTDIPVITFTNLVLKDMSSSSLATIQTNTIRGNISDDDGSIKELKYSYSKDSSGEPNWNDVSLSGSAFTFNLDDDTYAEIDDVDKKLIFYVKDKNDGEFTSVSDDTLSVPRIKGLKEKDSTDLVEVTNTNGTLYLIVDHIEPEVIDVTASQTGESNNWSQDVFKNTFGGDSNHNKFYVDLYAWDVNGIKSVTYQINNSAGKKKLSGNLSPADGKKDKKDASGEKLGEYSEYKSAAISLSNLDLDTGNYSLLLTVTDKGNKTKTITKDLSVDNSAPQLKITSHSDSDQEGQSFFMEGSFEDGDVGTKLYYQVTKNNVEAESLTWSDDNLSYGNSSISWKLYFDSDNNSVQKEGTDGFTHYLNPKYIVDALCDNVVISGGTAYVVDAEGKTIKYSTIEPYYFHFKVVDSYGNASYKTLSLKLDPQGDIPTVKLEYPAVEEYAYYNDSAAEDSKWAFSKTKVDKITKDDLDYTYVTPMATMSGIIRASGSATLINDSLNLYMQIDPSFVPDLSKTAKNKGFSSTWYDEVLTGTSDSKKLIESGLYSIMDFGPVNSKKKGIYLGSSLSWSKNINSSSEFEIYNTDKTNYIALRLYAYDNKENMSQTDDDIFIIRINSGAPKIGSSVPLQLKQYDNEGNVTAVLDYTENMWVKGEWYLEGSVEDENGIDDLSVTGGSGSLEKTEESWSEAGTSGYTFKYKIGSTSGAGSLSYTITATDVKKDEESGSHTTTKTITIRTDNNAPLMAAITDDYYNISTEMVNSNGFYTVQSAATEPNGESGFQRAFVYFKRGNTIYDAYFKKGVSGNTLAVGTNVVEGSEGLYWMSLGSVSSVNESEKKIELSDSPAANVHKGGLIKIADMIFTIDDVDDKTITLDESPDSSLEDKSASFAIGHVIDHVGSESKSAQIADSDYGYGYYSNNTEDDGDLMLETVSTVGTKTRWSGKINSLNIPDGAIEIHYVVFDKAGNAAPETVNAVVQNNAPRLASLKVSTDYNGNNKEDDGEYRTYYYFGKTRRISKTAATRATDVTKKLIVSDNGYGPNDSTKGTAFMTVRDDVKFIPEIIGGNGQLYYTYKTGTTSVKGGALTISGSDSTTGSYIKSDDDSQTYVEGQKAEITLAKTSLGANSTDDDPTWFEYTIWDSTDGTTVNTDNVGDWDSLNATFQVALRVIASDTSAPKAVVSPFFWNSASANSLYHNSKDNGHIELESDWKNASGHTSEDLAANIKDLDPKVSGKITVRGYVYDDVQLKELYVKIPGFVPGTYDFSTKYVKVAYYENGTWEPVVDGVADDAEGTNISTNHWTVSVTDEYNNGSGHKANFEFSWDTSYITGVAAANVTFYAQAVAVNGSSTIITTSSETPSTADTTEGVYNKPTYQMDIVPYITSLTTSLSSLKKSNPSVYARTARGHYPVYIVYNMDGTVTAENYETFTINGFNLALDNGSVTHTLDANSASGNFTYKDTENSIPTLNNYNKNDSYGSYSNSAEIPAQGNADIYENYYNRQPNGANNNNLTDDVVLDIWEFNPKAAQPKTGKLDQPIMKINPTNDKIGFAFADGPLNFNMGGKTAGNDSGDNNAAPANNGTDTRTEYSYHTWLAGYDVYSAIGFTYDALGYSYGVSSGGDINDSNSSDRFSFFSSRWGNGRFNNQGASKEAGKGKTRLEFIGQDNGNNNYVHDKQRMKSPCLATSVDGTTSHIYLAYYDSMNEEIRFKYGSATNEKRADFQNSGLFKDVADAGSGKPQTYDTCVQNANIIAGKKTGRVGGQYLGLGVDTHSDKDVVVVVWYDEVNATLWYAYNSSPTTSTAGVVEDKDVLDKEWIVSRVFASSKSYAKAGQYCQVAVDKNGGVHIAAYDPIGSDLVYAYSASSTSPSFKTCIVDGYSITGSNISLDVGVTSTGKAIPYIGYYSSSCVSPKYAYLPDGISSATTSLSEGAVSDKFSGLWESTVLPTTSTLEMNSKQYNHINVCAWKNTEGELKTSVSNNTETGSTYYKAGTAFGSKAYGNVTANGTTNPILGYNIKDGASSNSVETAQMR